jgi:protein-S-isoprenylcysteine O-methyltransferase Ste14/uncharacterized membrane protein (UPF0127 family)
MYRARDAASGVVLAERLRAAHTHWTRLKGLLGTRSLDPGDGLWLKPCNQVHMIGMRYAIDVVFLDDEHRIVRALPLRPWRISPKAKAATSTLELPAGTLARLGVSEGAQIEIDGEAEPGGTWIESLGAVASNILLAALYAFFAAAHIAAGQRTGRWGTALPLVIQEALLVFLFLSRRRSLSTSSRPFDWVIGATGAFLPLALRATDPVGPLNWLGEPVQIIGLAFAIFAIASLGRSIGVVAAARGIRTRGSYRAVRHPMYAAYMLSYVGYVASYPSVRNGLITATTLVALHARALVEERFLSGDPAYHDYRLRVRWRYLPYVY